MKIAVDFDGVIVEHNEIPSGSYFLNKPVKNSKEAIDYLISLGHELYICTNRDEIDWISMREWLKKNDFPKLRITNKKEKGTTIYLDDRAVRFVNWKDFTRYIK